MSQDGILNAYISVKISSQAFEKLLYKVVSIQCA